jgi:hypothetical protein
MPPSTRVTSLSASAITPDLDLGITLDEGHIAEHDDNAEVVLSVMVDGRVYHEGRMVWLENVMAEIRIEVDPSDVWLDDRVDDYDPAPTPGQEEE